MKKILLTLLLIILLPTISFTETSKVEIINSIQYYGELRSLPTSLIYQVIEVESEFNTNANSKHGKYADQGLMQLNNQWINSRLSANPIEKFDVFSIDDNINMGTYLLASIKASEESKGYTGTKLWERVLTAYNAGYVYLNKYGIRQQYVKQFDIEKIVKETKQNENDRKRVYASNKKNKENYVSKRKNKLRFGL